MFDLKIEDMNEAAQDYMANKTSRIKMQMRIAEIERKLEEDDFGRDENGDDLQAELDLLCKKIK